MNSVLNSILQEIIEMASVKLEEEISRESKEWDADALEQRVREKVEEFTREMRKSLLQVWAEAKAKQAEAKLRRG